MEVGRRGVFSIPAAPVRELDGTRVHGYRGGVELLQYGENGGIGQRPASYGSEAGDMFDESHIPQFSRLNKDPKTVPGMGRRQTLDTLPTLEHYINSAMKKRPTILELRTPVSHFE